MKSTRLIGVVCGSVITAAAIISVPITSAMSTDGRVSKEGSANLEQEEAAAQARVKGVEALVQQKRDRREDLEPLLRQRQKFLRSSSGKSTRASSIWACENKRSGALRIDKRCKGNERTIVWNIEGPTGPAGAAGPAGSAAASPVFYEDIYGPSASFAYYDNFTSACSRGGQAINGGFLSATVGIGAIADTQDATYSSKWFMMLENESAYYATAYYTVYCVL